VGPVDLNSVEPRLTRSPGSLSKETDEMPYLRLFQFSWNLI
jgi:hypothetical protein